MENCGKDIIASEDVIRCVGALSAEAVCVIELHGDSPFDAIIAESSKDADKILYFFDRRVLYGPAVEIPMDELHSKCGKYGRVIFSSEIPELEEYECIRCGYLFSEKDVASRGNPSEFELCCPGCGSQHFNHR